MENNPHLVQENYFDGYNQSIQDLKNNPQAIEFDKLCYEIFERQESGKRFMEMIIERYLIPGLARGNPTYQIDVLWQEGFKDAFRMILTAVRAHAQRIKTEKK